MATLEDALRAADCEIKEGETLVIDKTKFASRKRGKISILSRGKERLRPLDDSFKDVDDIDSGTKFWRDKYDELRLGKSEREKDLEDEVQKGYEKEEESSLQIKQLTADLANQKKKNENKICNDNGNGDIIVSQEDDTNVDINSNNALNIKLEKITEENNNLNEKLDTYRKKVFLYETMTSMKVKIENESEYTCTIKNNTKKIGTRFRIELKNDNQIDDDNEEEKEIVEVQYTPIFNSALLPEYLQTDISFEPNLAPVLLSDVLQALYDDDI